MKAIKTIRKCSKNFLLPTENASQVHDYLNDMSKYKNLP